MVWSYVNRGRTEGGTHETGLRTALTAFVKRITNRPDALSRPGFLAVISLDYPKVMWEGCIKGKVASAELQGKTSRVVTKALKAWHETHADSIAFLQGMTRFQIADFW